MFDRVSRSRQITQTFRIRGEALLPGGAVIDAVVIVVNQRDTLHGIVSTCKGSARASAMLQMIASALPPAAMTTGPTGTAAPVKHGLAHLANQGAFEYARISGSQSQLHVAHAPIRRPERLPGRDKK